MDENFPGCGGGVVVLNEMTLLWLHCSYLALVVMYCFKTKKKCNDPGVVVVRLWLWIVFFTDNNTTLGLCCPRLWQYDICTGYVNFKLIWQIDCFWYFD